MSKMVSARIPDAVYEQAQFRLNEMGSNISELVGSAFEYVLQKGSLPSSYKDDASHKRKLSAQERELLRKNLGKCTLNISLPDDIAKDKRTAREARAAHHEALA